MSRQMRILGQTRRQNMRMKSAHTMKKEVSEPKTDAGFVEFKNWECHLGSVKNSFPKSEQYVMKRQVTLGENFHLPLFYGVKVAKSYQIKEKDIQMKKFKRN